jgi:hypothetical protein
MLLSKHDDECAYNMMELLQISSERLQSTLTKITNDGEEFKMDQLHGYVPGLNSYGFFCGVV